MTMMIKSVNGLVIKDPADLSLEDYPLTKSGRVASGKMTAELIAMKRKFLMSFEVMSGTQLETLKRAIYGGVFFFPLVYVENGVDKSAIVYPGALKRQRFRTDGIWYWKSVTIDLIEQ